MVKVGVILSGCGVQDGSEIHEAVLTLLALDEAGAEAVCMAPNRSQTKVVEHTTQQPTSETRNVLVESARIARGKIRDIRNVRSEEIDALMLPGGFGAALNLCDFALKGSECDVDADVERLVSETYRSGKPIGAICIAPAVLAKVLGARGPRLTIGTDEGTASKLEAMGAEHVKALVHECIVDEANRIATSPAYMLAGSVKELKAGITKVVAEILRMANQPAAV